MDYGQWSDWPKHRRVDALAFLMIRGDVQQYMIHREGLEKIGADMEDWMGWDQETRDSKVKHARKVMEMEK